MNQLTESIGHYLSKEHNCWLDQVSALNAFWHFPAFDHASFAIVGIMDCATIGTTGRSEMAMAFH
jgi:hypothetical protein